MRQTKLTAEHGRNQIKQYVRYNGFYVGMVNGIMFGVIVWILFGLIYLVLSLIHG